ncbi:MAG: helix-turn-helix transcriptional regulator [Clostridiaceae bacterium]|nr:helix-turn-helix transcriptional regulator [Clostridiaceae bacterium]
MTKIQERRTAAGISRSELSRKSGVPLRTLEEWEAERRIPRDVYQLAKVAKALNCKIEDLIVLDD